ncbi:MAG: hypothetical protein AB7G06_08885 [Bdellovibrionales bacterium]
MDHSAARKVFEEIQARPYGLSIAYNAPANNCYFKGVELLQRLGVLGYAVRGRVGDTSWDAAIVPKHIMDLLPPDIKTTHFFVEAMIDGEWRALDPSLQPSLGKLGFAIGSWDNGKHCFPITKLYTQEESIAYQAEWFNEEKSRDFFERGAACWRALNAWFQEMAIKTKD